MSTIQSSSVALGRRSAVIAGTASVSTVRSIAYSRHGSAMTARPIHSRRVAREFMPVSLPRGRRALRMVAPECRDQRIAQRRRDLRLAQATQRAGDGAHLLEV